jgi:hypothetical protein
MSKRIQFGVSTFDEVEFPMKPGTIILKVTGFASIIIVGFDPTTVEVNDIIVGVIHASFFMETTIWLKTRSDLNGRQQSILQTLETRFFFTSFKPFETSSGSMST